MERLLTGLTGFSIKKVLSVKPTNLEVKYNQETLCRDCNSTKKRIKAFLNSATLSLCTYAATSSIEKSAVGISILG